MKTLQKTIDNIFSKLDQFFDLPGAKERALITDLRRAFDKIPVIEKKEQRPSEVFYNNWLNKLRFLVLNNDPRQFLQWGIIKSSMFCDYYPEELAFLQERNDWSTRWCKAIEESSIGKPTWSVNHLQSSGNLIHHAYHVAQFEDKTGMLIEDINFVFEFGGGYGSMCRLFRNLGFKGKYIIFDYPHFSALQKFYLKSLGVISKDNGKSDVDVVCVSNIKELISLFSNKLHDENNLFMATWSISESPVQFRAQIWPLLNQFNAFLIAYQGKFFELDNVDYFQNFKKNYMAANINWYEWQIMHLAESQYYLMGYKPSF